MSTLSKINKKIAASVPHTELVRGSGYHYVVFDDGKRFETYSIMTPHTSQMPDSYWVESAIKFGRSFMQAPE